MQFKLSGGFYITMKRLIALLLCLASILCIFAGCAKKEDEEEDPGAYIEMYLADQVYNFDPAYAYGNESALKIVSLLYENLFILGENGKPEKSLVSKYEIDKKENSMLITLRKDAYWTDGKKLTANDVVFAWQRVLDSSKSFDAAALLYDVKNARAAKEGVVPSIDDVGVQALNETEIFVEFEENVNYDNFILNLTSYALAPIRSDVITRTEKEIDWAKSTTTMATSGPFKIRTVSYKKGEEKIILERNSYYRRDYMEDKLDKAVKPYQIIINYSKTDKKLWSDYEKGNIFYMGDLPYSLRSKHSLADWAELGEVTDALSTHAYIFNENVVVRYYDEKTFPALSTNKSLAQYSENLVEGKHGDKIFAIKEVRQALSLAIDRNTIAKNVVFAEAANGLVPNGVFETDSKKNTFRDNDGEGLALSANLKEAKAKLKAAGIDPSKYMFTITVPSYDDVHVRIAKMVQKAWGPDGLGFHVGLNAIVPVDNEDIAIATQAAISGVKDDIFHEDYIEGKYEVAAIDYTALSANAFGVLAPFAKGYTGGASILPQTSEFFVATHKSGFDNKDYNEKIEAAFAEKDLTKRAKLLHEAEDILMTEMPIMPVIFNKTIALESSELSGIKYDYYSLPIFNDTKLKNYEEYIPEDAKKKKESDSESQESAKKETTK